MSDDFLNGLNIVPLDANNANQWIRSAIASPAEHPWRNLFQKREEPSLKHGMIPPETFRAPACYEEKLREPRISTRPKTNVLFKGRIATQLRPAAASSTIPRAHETIRLCDVAAFRTTTAKKVPRTGIKQDEVTGVSASLSRLSTASSRNRPVIYRYRDAVKNSIALLEAIHFDLFMPDRSDLRFLGIPLSSVPPGTLEGDYFHVADANLLSAPSFAVKLARGFYPFGCVIYPVVWEAQGIQKLEFAGDTRNQPQTGLAYVLKKKANTQGSVSVISEISDRDFLIRETLFPDADARQEHSLVHVTATQMATAHLYAVEPPLPGPDRPAMVEKEDEIEKGGRKDFMQCFGQQNLQNGKKQDKKDTKKKKKGKKGEEEEEEEFDPRSEYLKQVCRVPTSSVRFGRIGSVVRALDATEAERIEDRLGAFTTYGQEGDLQLMDKLFRLGSRYRDTAREDGEDSKDALDFKIDESVILKTLTDRKIGHLEECRPLLDCIYGRRGRPSIIAPHEPTLLEVGDFEMRLNAGQSRALHACTDAAGPRVFCILSPPGSGKTTVAAAMAVVGAYGSGGGNSSEDDSDRDDGFPAGNGVQLLLSVQNVAVDNMGAAMKKMGMTGAQVYNMKSTTKMDPHCPAPFDYLDLMEEENLKEWKDMTVSLKRNVQIHTDRGKDRDQNEPLVTSDSKLVFEEKELSYEEALTFDRRKFECVVDPKIILSTVEMVLQKFYTHSKLCGKLAQVRRVIIDEASLLTEAALFCVIRRFPNARIVLIGDDHQLPPFMYEENILGHELAGRAALTVAMKTGRVPVVELNEVYRAPPSLVAPYNRLSYGGRLVSKKAEGAYPLSDIGLIHHGLPQLLLIDVDGMQERNERTMSLYNPKEVKALQRLLRKFPNAWKQEIMIICLYKEQMRRLQSSLDKDYTILTVDSAQGKEKSIVILMTTRTAIPKTGSFFDSPERCNVSVSRQQKALIILGKASLLITNKPWSTVVNGDDFTRIKAEDIK